MKHNKHFVRLLAASLVLVISLAPVTVHATTVQEGIVPEENENKKITNSWWWVVDSEKKANDKGFTVKAEDYEKYIAPFGDNQIFERVGMGTWNSQDTPVNDVEAIDVPAFPLNGTPEEQAKWHDTYDYILVAYMEHKHDLTNAPWHFDNNYHWKYCQKCRNRVFLEWHSDKNNDGVCDFCDNPIHYYKISVKDAPGGKVSLSADKGAMNDRINVTVTPDAGYHLESIKFFNNNAIHSQLTCWEDKALSDYHFVILNWDIDVEAAFVKD